MAQTQIFYIATSKKKEIRKGASVTFTWGAFDAWTDFKKPVAASTKKVAYNKSTKNSANTSNGKYGGTGGKTVLGTAIPGTATRLIDGVSRTVDVRYYQRGYIVYDRPKDLKKKKKMKKTTYTNSKPKQYRLQYKDKGILSAAYSTYQDGKEYIFFDDVYYNDAGTAVTTGGHIMHPSKCTMKYSDCRRNFESSANNSDGRDNSGSYVLSNVRANIVTFELEWTGLSEAEGIDLLNTLNPEKNTNGEYPYLIVQYLDPQTGSPKNGTFFAGERSVEKYPNGVFKSISVQLTEV